MSILASVVCPSLRRCWMEDAHSRTTPSLAALSFGQGRAHLTPVPGSTEGPSPVLGLSQDPSRLCVLEDISFDFHYKATSMSLVAPVWPTRRWRPMVQSLKLS